MIAAQVPQSPVGQDAPDQGAVTHVLGYVCAVASTFQTQTNVSEPGMVWMVN
jgi:hypothetical protein